MPRFCTAGLLSIPDYNTSLLRPQPSLLPSTRSSTLTSTFNTCTLTQTNSSDVIEFASLFVSLSLSICLHISISLSGIQMCLPLVLSLEALHIYHISPPVFLFHLWFFLGVWWSSLTVPLSVSFSLTYTACVQVCQNIANHWPDVKPLCDLFVPKHILGRKKYLKSN